jgi:2-polyprenyl-3-methyl-5-hydroxy-6-metoxy-1,4-benzoquinol methylase
MLTQRAIGIDSAITLSCEAHREPLRTTPEGILLCGKGCSFLVVGGIPRLVPAEEYTASFGLQWNHFRRTQLDSYTGHPISRQRLTRLLGGSLDGLRGKLVLEAGCGAGRFTELLLEAGARVVAVDLSTAVDANRDNCSRFAGHAVIQGDIRRLPFAPEQFDVVVCVGVVQHTPDPEETMTALCRHVKPGGLLVMDHYTHGAHRARIVPKLVRELLIRQTPEVALETCEALMRTLWPIHQASWWLRRVPGAKIARKIWLRMSPLVDYHDEFSHLGPRLVYEWALLDMHDSLTDRYKHLRSADQIREQLIDCGMVEIETVHAGNGVEVRARKASRV